ncbi:pentapeptide repeat-containing protein, partial [Mesorhizobium sp. M00.F.Ca.ET.186.01.1.1]
EEAFIKSINIGTPEQPNILVGEEARKWLKDNK